MSWDLILLIFSFIATMGLLAITIYQLICLSDLESDYINPFDSSSRINALVVKEFLVQGMLCAAFILTWHWFMFLLSAPITYYHLTLYMKRKHLIDVTEIFSLLNSEKKYRIVKLVLYLSLFAAATTSLVKTAVDLIIDDDDGFPGFETF
ncbi:hypothetical protein GIB67_003400 [Kingdonia uniflora]|uniref:Protein cornichon homolog 1 n=1 Tax=Kingdonia uniflora TaxID=39325 RepID=A0A7J7P9E1_9MAGN|nr:hypothetical protein GIB67_003400 [Kingdonia uniflora]